MVFVVVFGGVDYWPNIGEIENMFDLNSRSTVNVNTTKLPFLGRFSFMIFGMF